MVVSVAITLLLIVVAVIVYRATTPEEHARMLDAARAAILRGQDRLLRRTPEEDAFGDVLRTRGGRPLVTLVLAALHTIVFLCMLFSRGAFSDPDTLLRWGASLGVRTTNGEWWRLATSTFVQAGFLAFLVNTASLFQLGIVLERLAGRAAFVAVYLIAGTIAGLSDLSGQPVSVTAGPSGAIAGLYGMLLAAWACSVLRRSAVTIPLAALRALVPAAVLFAIASLTLGSVAAASELAGFLAGFFCGAALAFGPDATAAKRAAGACAAAAGFALVWGFTLRGITDVRPEIDRVVALEARTASAYAAALNRFKSGRLPMPELVNVIERAIVPDLKAEQERFDRLERVPAEHRLLVKDAVDYLRHRTDSWQLRAEGLRKIGIRAPRGTAGDDARVQVQARYHADMLTLGKAETQEREALEALDRIRPQRKEEPGTSSSLPAPATTAH